MCGALQTRPPSGPNRAQEKSSLSYKSNRKTGKRKKQNSDSHILKEHKIGMVIQAFNYASKNRDLLPKGISKSSHTKQSTQTCLLYKKNNPASK